MTKGTSSPIVKFGLVALAILAVILVYTKMTSGNDSEELGTVPPPKYDPVSPLDPQNVIGGGGPTPVKK